MIGFNECTRFRAPLQEDDEADRQPGQPVGGVKSGATPLEVFPRNVAGLRWLLEHVSHVLQEHFAAKAR
jgi:hypothetical protein